MSKLEHFERALGGLQRELRDNVLSSDDEKHRALFETSAEVLEGLQKAFRHSRLEKEPAWQAVTQL